MEPDTQQLLRFSKYYLQLAKRIKCPIDDQSKTIGQLYDEYPNNKNSNVYLLMAHLASAAYRAATIIDKYPNIRQRYNYRRLGRRKFNGNIADEMRKNLVQYLPMLLRDLVGHDLEGNHALAKPRREIVHELTPVKCRDILSRSILQIEKDLKDNQRL